MTATDFQLAYGKRFSTSCRRRVFRIIYLLVKEEPAAPAIIDRSQIETTVNDALDATPMPCFHNDSALNALRIALQALCAISRCVPLPGIHLPFDALLAIFDKVKTTHQNHQGFRDLAMRLKALYNIIVEIDNGRNPPVELLVSLKHELESLNKDIKSAIYHNKIERFINSTEDAASLTAHDNALRIIIHYLSLSVSVRTGAKVDRLEEKLTTIGDGIARIEERSTQYDRTPQMQATCDDGTVTAWTQSFHGSKINTRGIKTAVGGHIGSTNYHLKSQRFVDVDFTTGGGMVGSNNTFLI